MSPLTILLARLIGLFTLIFSVSMAAHRETSIAVVSALVYNRPMMLMFGMIALAAGLAMVLSHNRWSGGALTIVVTLVGWIFLVRGLLLLFMPPQVLEDMFEGLRFEDFYYYYAVIPFLLGLYLTTAGFRTSPR